MTVYVHDKRKLRFFAICFVLGVALAIYGALTANWFVFVLAVTGGLSSVPAIVVIRRGGHPRWLRSMDDPAPSRDDRGHDPQKLPILIAFVVLAVGLGLYGALDGFWFTFALAVALLLTSLASIWAIRTGRHPWWLRGYRDPRSEQDRR